MTITYTQDQLDIALLKQRSDELSNTMKEIKRDLMAQKSEMMSQFHFVNAMILGLYGIIVAGAISKVFGVM